MSDDPDQVKYEQAISKNNPEVVVAIEEIEQHLRYGIPSIKFLLSIVIALLALILWQVWH